MTRGYRRTIGACIVALATLLAQPALAAVTGKIAGTVTDAATGEPLVGAAVAVVGANLGATTDADGNYFIINVPPGTYSLRAAFVGYQSLVKQNVRVNVDRTIDVNFEINQAAIDVGEVVVTADREVIKLDVSGSSTIIGAGEVEAVPRASLQEALALQPGVGVEGDIRGGTLDQTQMIVDGRVAVDERLNRPVMTVSTTALEEVQVLTGGFNAEYGNARSGVINVVTKSALDRPIWGAVDVQYYPAHVKFFEPDGFAAYGPNSREWLTYGSDDTTATLVGTMLDPNDNTQVIPDTLHPGWDVIAASAQNINGLTAAQLRDKWRLQHPAWDYGNDPDYVVDAAVGIPLGRTAGIVLSGRTESTAYATPQYVPSYTDDLFGMKLNLRPVQALRLDIGATYEMVEGLGSMFNEGLDHTIYRDFGSDVELILGGGEDPARKYAQYSLSTAKTTRLGLNVNAAYAIDAARVFEAGIDYNAYNYELGPSNEPITVAAVYQGTAGNDTVLSLPTGWLGDGYFDGTELAYDLAGGRGDMDSSDYNSVRLYASFTNQIGTRNLVKVGGEAVFTTINQYGGQVSSGSVVTQKFTAEPTRMAMYAQDKIEYEGMIANIGLRLDYFDAGMQIVEPDDPFSDVFDENVWGDRSVEADFDVLESIRRRFGEGGTIVADSAQFADPSAKVHVSPRLGVSHPISRSTKIFFNYGHFYSLPQSQWLYGNSWNSPGSIAHSGNPNLDMPLTIAYELGLDQELLSQYLLRASVYYKDATNEVRTLGFTSSGPQKYTRFLPYNKQYSDIRGFEFSFSKRIGRWVTGFINGGTETVTSKYLGPAEIFSQEDGFAGTRPVEEEQPTSSRIQPYAKLNVDLHTPMDLAALGMPATITGGWSLSWLTEYKRGDEYLYDPVGDYVKQPNAEFQDWWMTDMRLTKSFSVSGYHLAVYADVLNVFDRKIWNGGMRQQDLEDYLKSLHLPIDDPLVEDTPGNDKIGDTPSYAKLPTTDQWALWKYPRSYALGLRLSF